MERIFIVIIFCSVVLLLTAMALASLPVGLDLTHRISLLFGIIPS